MRRLEAQLDGASAKEVAALRSGDVNLAKHAVIARWVTSKERSEAIAVFTDHSIKTNDMTTLFQALGWDGLNSLGPQHKTARLRFLRWVCAELSRLGKGSVKERLNALAVNLPVSLEVQQMAKVAR